MNADGQITTTKEYERFTKAATILPQEKLARDYKLDAIEILALYPSKKPAGVNQNNICNNGTLERTEEFRYDRQLGSGTTGYIFQDEVEYYLLQRMCSFFPHNNGHPTVDVLAAFAYEDAMILKRLRDAMAEQAYRVDRDREENTEPYMIKGTTKNYDVKAYDRENKLIGRPTIYKSAGRIIVYFNTLTDKEKEDLSKITKAHQRHIRKPLTLQWDNIQVRVKTKPQGELSYTISVRRFSYFDEDQRKGYHSTIAKNPAVGPFQLYPQEYRKFSERVQ